MLRRDIGRYVEGFVVAMGFAVAGYFLSRNIAYRMMSGEMVWAYLPVCIVVEFVEIFCNYVVGVSALHLEDFLQGIPVGQHALILLIGRIVVSSIPAMTLFLAVAHMDLERRKAEAAKAHMASAAQLKQPHAASYGQGYTGNAGTSWNANQGRPPQQPQPLRPQPQQRGPLVGQAGMQGQQIADPIHGVMAPTR
jgi:hypothetical protein